MHTLAFVVLVPGMAGSIMTELSGQRIWPPTVGSMFQETDPYLSSVRPFVSNEILPIYDPLRYSTHTDLIAPYDMKRLGDEKYLHQFYKNIRLRIEGAGERAHLIGHSLGGLILHEFLTHEVDEWWKDKYVQNLVSLHVPYGGTTMACDLIDTKKATYPFIGHTITVDNAHELGGVLWSLPNRYMLSTTKRKIPPPFQQIHKRCAINTNVRNHHLLFSNHYPGKCDDTVTQESALSPLQRWPNVNNLIVYNTHASHIGVLFDVTILTYLSSLSISPAA